MKRKALDFLNSWYNSDKSKPLILRGARQVGKSTLVQLFCQANQIQLIELNFESIKLNEIENEHSFSIYKVIQEIELISRKKIKNNCLIFFDEVQLQPKVINRLRYFYENKPTLRIIAAGSLLEVTLDAADFSMPVGRVQYYHLGPMTFSEFLMAKQEDIFLEQMSNRTLKSESNATYLHRGEELLKEFYFTGGMPEAIQCWIDSKNHEDVRDIHNSIIQTYRDDIPKYTRNSEQLRVSEVFEYCVANLGNKVVYSEVATVHSSAIKSAIDLLAKANVVTKTTFNYCNGLPLQAGIDPSIMKLYFLDIGLYNALLETRWVDIYKLSSEKLLTKGNMAEQFIAQHLKYLSPKTPLSELYYWLFNKKKGAAEIDFIVSNGGNIYPIEVKAGKTGKIKSLWKYIEEKQSKFIIKFDLMERRERLSQVVHKLPANSQKGELSSNLIGLPLFEIENLNLYLDSIHQE